MENIIHITRARHAWPEKAGFIIDRPKGLPEYTFLHFHNSVEILVDGEVVVTPPGAVIFFAADTPQWFRSPDPLLHDWMHMTGNMETMLRDVGLVPDRLYFPGNSRFITPILRQIELEVLTDQPHRSELAELKLRELLILLHRSCMGQEGAERPDSAAVKRLRQVRSAVFSQMEEEIATLLEENVCLKISDLAISGRDLMGLGIPAGPQLGSILSQLLCLVQEETLPNSPSALLEWANTYWKGNCL